METLHTVLLGPYKYLLKSTLPKLSSSQKEELLARIRAFSFSGFHVRLIGNVVGYHQSFVGRDYKAWAQMAPFVLFPYLAEEHRTLWLALSKVSSLAWCDLYKYYHCQFCEGLQDCLLRLLPSFSFFLSGVEYATSLLRQSASTSQKR